jgi:roadblock/LC7 domain-containing protein
LIAGKINKESLIIQPIILISYKIYFEYRQKDELFDYADVKYHKIVGNLKKYFMKTTKLLAIGLLIITLSATVTRNLNAQESLQVSNAERFIAYSLYNFSKLIDWPNSGTATTFQIAIVGDKRVYVELLELAKNKKVGNATYTIVFCKDMNELYGYNQIVYLANAYSGKITELTQTQTKGVLLVTERAGMTKKGSAISFMTNNQGTMGFEIAKENAEKNQLNIRQQLERMAMNVI